MKERSVLDESPQSWSPVIKVKASQDRRRLLLLGRGYPGSQRLPFATLCGIRRTLCNIFHFQYTFNAI